MTEKKYHIYYGDKCIYHSLEENDFHLTWKMISQYLSITDEKKKKKLSYKEI